MQTIIYIMRHIDIGGHIDIPYKKIGITGGGNASLTSRLQQISNTKSPIKAQCISAWEHSNARAIENALHSLMEDSRVEGEWFLDKENTLVERMTPIMDLIGAKRLVIEESDDSYTKKIIQRETEEKQKLDHILLSQISELLKTPLKSSSRKDGPTFFSKNRNLTYYVNARKSGNHQLHIGRSKDQRTVLQAFLEREGYDVDENNKDDVKVMNINKELVAEIINLIESDYSVE